jgi:hypothetical protein
VPLVESNWEFWSGRPDLNPGAQFGSLMLHSLKEWPIETNRFTRAPHRHGEPLGFDGVGCSALIRCRMVAGEKRPGAFVDIAAKGVCQCMA